MTLIDQRILIDAPPHLVWEYVSDPDKLARWHAGYASVSVLTTQHTGIGTRRRCARVGGGKDIIEEITAWVEGLGYEYRLVDGALQGRIRLQAGPDGTSVQWTVSYHPKGLIGSLKDRFGGRQQEITMMAASLRQLRRQIDDLGQRMDENYRAKVSIQDRLNANERASYQRRYPVPDAADGSEAEVMPGSAAPAGEQAPAPSQPAPIAESVEPGPPLAAPPVIPEPSFVADLSAGPDDAGLSHDVDTQPKAPEGLRAAISAPDEGAGEERAAPEGEVAPEGDVLPADEVAPGSESPAAREVAPGDESPPAGETPATDALSPFARPVAEDAPLPPPPTFIEPPAPALAADEEPDYRRPTPPRGIPSVQPAIPQEPRDEDVPTRDDGPPRDEGPRAAVDHMTAEERRAAGLPPQTPKTDSGEISIWEVFGLQRPSDQDEAALQDLIQSVYEKEAALETGQQRQKRPAHVRRLPTVLGLRLRLALQAVRVRLHQSLFTQHRQD